MAGAVAVSLAVSVAAGATWSALDRPEADTVVIPDGPVGTDGVPLDAVQPPTLGTNAALRGASLPSAMVTDLTGRPIDTASLVGGPLVVNIWGSTCGPCRREQIGRAHV